MAQLPAIVLGAGDAGVDEMRPFVDENAVQWALLRFELGEGSFRRQKILFLHINGEGCAALARGRANQLTGEVKQLLRGEGSKDPIHASVEVKRQDEVRADVLLERVARFFITDDSAEFSVQWMLKEYERQIQESSKAHGKGSEGGGDTGSFQPRGIPRRTSRLIFTTGRDALKAVGEPLGPWNWVMLEADPEAMELVGGGDDSIDGMQSCVESHANIVMFGLLRMGFGEGRLRRTKYVFVHANGSGVSAVTRGRLGAHRSAMQQALGQVANLSVTLEVNDPEALSLEDVIERVRRAAIIDDDVLGKDEAAKSIFTVDAFRQALAEEQIVTASFTKDEEEEEDEADYIPGAHYTVPEVVQLLRAADAPLNWALFGPNQAFIRERRCTMAPPVPGTKAVPSGGYLAAKKRASSVGPTRHSIAPAASEEDAPEAQPQRRPSLAGGAQQRASSALPLGSFGSGAPAAAPEVRLPSLRAGAAPSSPRASAGGGYPKAPAAPPPPAQEGGAGAPPVHATVPTAELPSTPMQTPAPARRKPRLAGPLLKQSGTWLRGWQIRWCEVGQGSLRWWDSPADAQRGVPSKGAQQLLGMKVKKLAGTTSQFTLETATGKDKLYVFDANSSKYVRGTEWGVAAVAGTVTISAEDWIKALEQESIALRRETFCQEDGRRNLPPQAAAGSGFFAGSAPRSSAAA